MSQHTLNAEKQRRFVTYKNGKRVVFGFMPVPAAIGLSVVGAGAALAAVLLTTNVVTDLTVEDVATSNSFAVEASVVSGTALDCSGTNVTGDYKTLTLKAHLKRPTSGPNTEPGTVPIPGGTCKIKLSVKNTGTTPLKLAAGSTVSTDLPTGWSVTPLSGAALAAIAPGDTAVAEATLTAAANAVAGKNLNAGKLTYTDA